jgi:hypothetical protein
MASTEQEKTTEKTATSDRFPIERILSADECFAITGVERHLVIGALYGTTKSALTTDEVNAAVSKWLASPAKEN